MSLARAIAAGCALILLVVSCLNRIPGLTDAQGLVLGVFALDVFDDALHFASACWAAVAAALSHRAAIVFLRTFGALYLADGLLGLLTGSGYLDFGIVLHGVQSLPFGFRMLANLPHVALGGFTLAAGIALGARAGAVR